MEQRPEDGKWKFSNRQQVGQSIAGNAFLESQDSLRLNFVNLLMYYFEYFFAFLSKAENPAEISSDSNCFYFKTYGPKKNRRFKKLNCPTDPELIGINDGSAVVGIEFVKIPKSRASMLNGLYQQVDPPTETLQGKCSIEEMK